MLSQRSLQFLEFSKREVKRKKKSSTTRPWNLLKILKIKLRALKLKIVRYAFERSGKFLSCKRSS